MLSKKRLINIAIHSIGINILAGIWYFITRDLWESVLFGILGMFLIEFIEGRHWAWWGRVVERGLAIRGSIRGIPAIVMAIKYPLGLSEKGKDPLWDWAGPSGVLIIEALIYTLFNMM